MHPHDTALQITLNGFSAADQLVISESGVWDAARVYGEMTASRTEAQVQRLPDITGKSPADIREMAGTALRSVTDLAAQGYLSGGTPYLSRYLEALDGFRSGAGISMEDAVALQMDIQPKCQTLIAESAANRDIVVLHTEENSDDAGLTGLYERIGREGRQALDDPSSASLYDYQMVTIRSSERHQTYFAYPGLSAGGSAFGMNLISGTLVLVDYIFPTVQPLQHAVWANIIPAVALECGDISVMKEMLAKLVADRIGYFGGYAVHMVQVADDRPELYSFEFGADILAEVPPMARSGGRYIAMSNYPRLKRLAEVDQLYADNTYTDPLLAQYSIENRLRAERLSSLASRMSWPQDDGAAMHYLSSLITDPSGDIETLPERTTLTGFVGPSVAAALTARIRPGGGICAVSKLNLPDRLFPIADITDEVRHTYGAVDLLRSVQDVYGIGGTR